MESELEDDVRLRRRFILMFGSCYLQCNLEGESRELFILKVYLTCNIVKD